MVFIFWFVACGAVGLAIGRGRNNAMGGFWLGFLLGPIGWIITAVTDYRPQCPACASRINPGARICPACRSGVMVSPLAGQWRAAAQSKPSAAAVIVKDDKKEDDEEARAVPSFVWKGLTWAAVLLSTAIRQERGQA